MSTTIRVSNKRQVALAKLYCEQKQIKPGAVLSTDGTRVAGSF